MAGTGKSGKGFHGKHGAKKKVEVEETPEQHAVRNLEIFENNLAGLGLPRDVVGKGSAGERYEDGDSFCTFFSVVGREVREGTEQDF